MSPTIGSVEDKSIPSFDFDFVDIPMGYHTKKLDICIIKPRHGENFSAFNGCIVQRGNSGELYVSCYDIRTGESRVFINPQAILHIRKPEYLCR